jgi:hypothetical protein
MAIRITGTEMTRMIEEKMVATGAGLPGPTAAAPWIASAHMACLFGFSRITLT